MALRVTFDTNVLDMACRPELFPNNDRQPLMRRVHEALANGHIEGFYSATILTIEGIKKKDRARVFAGTRTVMERETSHTARNADLPDAIRETVGGRDVITTPITLRVEQPERTPLPPAFVARVQAAKALGVKALRAVPR
ncbi:MAG TPA: hypothetical protein VEX11_01250, partial [Acetobacteraceae bacterium]|nr:hypothetical protein [Acetobacteraceae bacterium]